MYLGRRSVRQDLSSSISLFYMNNVAINNLHVVSNNPCYGAYLYFSSVTFIGYNSTFFNNTSKASGGAMLLSSSSSIKLYTFVNFINNVAAELGGGIYVDTDQLFFDFCFLEVSGGYSNSSSGLVFVNNTAGFQGDAIYIGTCARLQRDQKMIGDDIFNIIHLDGQANTSKGIISSDPYLTFHCGSGIIKHMNAYPGETVNLHIVTKGFLNVTNKGLIKIKEIQNSTSKVSVSDTRLIPSSNNSQCVTLPVDIRGNELTDSLLIYVCTIQKQYNPQGLQYTNRITFNVAILECPIGFTLVNTKCHCNQQIMQLVPNITCNITTRAITRAGNKWIGLEGDVVLVALDCPFDYCQEGTVSFDSLSYDRQCSYNRTDTLCGSCASGLSVMLGSNQCGDCTDSTLYVIALFALAGVLLVAFLLVLNMTVSSGTINGIIFYANVIKINENAFLNAPPTSLPVLYQFISWFNLDVGINMCFSSGLDSITKLWLQFVFPAYIWILIATVIIVCKYSQKLGRMIGHNAVPVFATLILLSYTKALRTLVPILMFNRVTVISRLNEMSHRLYWSADGNVSMTSPKYLSLVCFSLAVTILFALPYTLLLVFQPLLLSKVNNPYFQRHCLRLKSLFDAYHGPYNAQLHSWTGILLCARLVLVVIAPFVSYNLYLSVTGIVCIIALTILAGYSNNIRKKTFAYRLEYWSILNVALLALLARVVADAAIASMSLILATFAVVVLYHIIRLKMFSNYIIQKLKDSENQRLLSSKRDSLDTLVLSRNNVSTTHVRATSLLVPAAVVDNVEQ